MNAPVWFISLLAQEMPSVYFGTYPVEATPLEHSLLKSLTDYVFDLLELYHKHLMHMCVMTRIAWLIHITVAVFGTELSIATFHYG